MKSIILLHKDVLTLIALLFFVILMFIYIGMLHPERSTASRLNTPSVSIEENGSQSRCGLTGCKPANEEDLSQTIPSSPNTSSSKSGAEKAKGDLPWKSDSSAGTAPNAGKTLVQKTIGIVLLSGLVTVCMAACFAFYYIPLRFFLKRAGHEILSLKFYLQSFASMMIMVVTFSGILIFATGFVFI